MKLLTKEEFIEYIEFIQEQYKKQLQFIVALDALCPGKYCNTFIFAEYENKLFSLIQNILEDNSDLIGYKMWDFDVMSPEDQKRQIEETPEVESWETVYDYLVSQIKLNETISQIKLNQTKTSGKEIVKITKEAYKTLIKNGKVDISDPEDNQAWERTLYTIGRDSIETSANMAAVSFDLKDGLRLVNLEIAEENSGVIVNKK